MSDIWHYYCPRCGKITTLPTWIRVVVRCFYCKPDQGGDPLASPDATWEELGRGFIANEPDMTEGGE